MFAIEGSMKLNILKLYGMIQYITANLREKYGLFTYRNKQNGSHTLRSWYLSKSQLSVMQIVIQHCLGTCLSIAKRILSTFFFNCGPLSAESPMWTCVSFKDLVRTKFTPQILLAYMEDKHSLKNILFIWLKNSQRLPRYWHLKCASSPGPQKQNWNAALC